MSAPETTVVIRTFNEARHLPTLLQCLHEQDYQRFEVVIVDSGSVDGTRDIARDWGAHLVRLDREHFTFGYSLNVGIRTARGRFVAIVSAHTQPVDGCWLGALVGPLRDPHAAMVYGRQLGAPNSKFSEVEDFRRTFGSTRRILRPPEFFANNANSAIQRYLWEQHPFDEALPGLEDIEWARRWMELGYAVVYEPTAALYHIHNENWSQVRHRYYREAAAARQIGLKGPRSVPSEIGRETMLLAADLSLAAGRALGGTLRVPVFACAKEIVAFRVNKTAGTVHGLLDGAALATRVKGQPLFFESSFEAVVIEGPGRASLQQIPMPEVRPGDVVIRVAYVGVCRTDLEIYDGTLGYYADGVASYPIVPGHEMSGYVVATGSSVTGLKEHDPVVVECIQSCGLCEHCRGGNFIACPDRRELGVLRANGAYARYVVVPSRFVHRIDDRLDIARATLCEPLAVVLKGLDRLERAWLPWRAERRCAVIGGGPLGRLSALVLARRGHRVTLHDRDPRRLEGLDHLGISTASELTGLEKYEALVEATGDPGALEVILTTSRAGSTILLLGLPYACRPFSFEHLVAYDKVLVGSVGSSAANFEEAMQLLPDLDLDAYMRNIVPLGQYAHAWARLRERKCLKVLLQVE
jgi:2-desacetyl-2-hydroxyethyl bacteriochlorophyllide A dehydrogenase